MSVVNNLIGKIFITPRDDFYKLISAARINKKPVYTYEWINCPDHIKCIVSHRLKSSSLLSMNDIQTWIQNTKQTALENTGK